MREITLDDEQRRAVRDALDQALAVARTYRESVADEDSIVLLQELLRLDAFMQTGLARESDGHLA